MPAPVEKMILRYVKGMGRCVYFKLRCQSFFSDLASVNVIRALVLLVLTCS
jgi:hypothetical protein